MARTVEVEWSDVKHRFIDSVRHGKRWSQAQQRTLRGLYADPYTVDSWVGGSGAQTLDWLDHGYFSDELQATPEMPVAQRVRVGWSEEDGDIDVGRLYGGYDDFYLEVSPSDSKPGLTIVADVWFSAATNSRVIKAYGAWLCGLIGALESSGYDLTVDLRLPVDQLCGEGRGDGSTDVIVHVKKAGELSDFTEWSAAFSPTALRHLFFTAQGLAADKLGKQQSSFMASARLSRRWNVIYREDSNTLDIRAMMHGSSKFPVEHMNEGLQESGLI
jgi:hypothetical protein